MKDYQTCLDEVAKKYGFYSLDKGFKALPISDLYKEVVQLYASECVKEAVKLAREEGWGSRRNYEGEDEYGSYPLYTEQEILEKLKL